jgi:hypothetical protein
MLLRQLLLLLQFHLGAPLFILPDELALQLAQCLQKTVRGMFDPRGLLQHIAGIVGKLLGGILEFDFGHSTLAPPHLIQAIKV